MPACWRMGNEYVWRKGRPRAEVPRRFWRTSRINRRCFSFGSRWDGSGIARCRDAARMAASFWTACGVSSLAGCLCLPSLIPILSAAWASSPKARAGCGSAACPDPWRWLCAIMIPTPTCQVRGLSHVVFSVSSFSLVLIDPCGRGGVREHPRERTRTDGTDPARHPPPEVVQVSVDRDGAVRPLWIRRNRPLAAPAGALTPSAAAYEADARSLQPTAVTRPVGPISRGGSAPQGFRTQI